MTEQEKFQTLAAKNAMNPLFRKGLHAATLMASAENGQHTPASRKLVKPMEQKMARLENAMQSKIEDAALEQSNMER